MIKRIVAILLILCSTCYANPIDNMRMVLARKNASGSDYSDIIFYHDADALDNANKSGGSATVTYGGSVLSETSTPIVGTGSWDGANAAWSNGRVAFATSGNIDFVSGRIGFHHEPKEDNTGRLLWTDGSDFYVQRDSSQHYTVQYLGTTTNGLGTFVVDTAKYLEFEFNTTSVEFFVDGVSQGTVTGSGAVDDANFYFNSNDANSWDSWYDQLISSNDPDRDLNAVKTVTDFS